MGRESGMYLILDLRRGIVYFRNWKNVFCGRGVESGIEMK